jgi:hypothetical protein
MVKLQSVVVIIAFFLSITAAACATAANKTEDVGNDTGSAASSVGNGVVSVIEWPFHVVADIL